MDEEDLDILNNLDLGGAAQAAQQAADSGDLDLDSIDLSGGGGGETPAAAPEPGSAEDFAKQYGAAPGDAAILGGEGGLGQQGGQAVQAAVGGGVKSILETKDFLFGEPAGSEKSAMRERFEGQQKVNEDSSVVAGLASDIGQFAVAMVGAGKVVGAAKLLPWFGSALKAAEAAKFGAAAVETAKAAAVGAVAFDPFEERLSNTIQQFPVLANPVTAWLAASPDDTAAEGRMKAAFESIGLDAALFVVFKGAGAVYKAIGRGDAEGASKAVTEMEDKIAADQAMWVREAPEAPAPAAPAGPGEEVARAGFPEEAPLTQDNVRSYRADNQTPGSTEAIPEASEVPGRGKGEGAPAPANENTESFAQKFRRTYVEPPEQANKVMSVKDAPLANDNGPIAGPGKTTVRSGGTLGEEAAPKAAPTMAREPLDPNMVREAPEGQAPVPSLQGEGGGAQRIPIQSADEGGAQVSRVKNVTEARANEGAGPAGATPVPFRDENSAEVHRRLVEDAEAIAEHGSFDEAVKAGHAFAGPDLVPYNALNTSQDLTNFIGRMSTEFEGRFAKMKGGDVMTDARLNRTVSQLAGLLGEDPLALVGMIRQAGQQAPRMAAAMEAGYIVAERMGQDLYTMALREGMGDFSKHGGSRATLVEEAIRRIDLAGEALGNALAIRSNAGRTLRRNRKEFRWTPEQLAALKAVPPERLMEVIRNTGGNPKALQQALNPSLLSQIGDWSQFLFVNNLVSGWKTQLVNILGNGYMVAARPLERMVGSAIRDVASGQRIGTSAVFQESVKQYGYLSTAFVDGFQSAKRAFLLNDSVLNPHGTELYQGAQGVRGGLQPLPFKPMDSVANILHNAYLAATPKGLLNGAVNAIGMPTRALGFTDELVKQTVYRSKLMAASHVEGVTEAARLGITGKDLDAYVKQYVQTKLENGFDDFGRATDAAALREAQVATFQQELGAGTMGKGFQNLTNNFPPLKLILPFVKTPTNVLRYGWKMSPGLNLLQKEYRQAFLGQVGDTAEEIAEHQAQAVGQMAMGSMFAMSALGLAANGSITGGGPSDYKLRQELEATGWRAYSFIWTNADGSKRYIPFNRLDPIAVPFGTVADIVDFINAKDRPDEEDMDAMSLFTGLTLSLAKQFQSRSYLEGAGNALEVLVGDDPDKVERFAGGIATNMAIPFSAMQRQVNPDPYLREVVGMVDRLKANVPGLSQTLPAKYDAWGDPILAQRGLWADDKASAVDNEMVRLGIETGATPQRVGFSQNGVDLREVQMADGRNAYEVYQQLSGHLGGRAKSLKDIVAAVIEKPFYQNAPDGDARLKGTKSALITQRIAQYRQRAMAKLKADPNVRAAFQKAQLRVWEERRANLAKPKPERPGVGEAFGVDLSALGQ